MITTFIVEEHFEAYIVWKLAILDKLIMPQHNVLLHLDEHGDMGAAKLNVPLKSQGTNLKSIANFSYQELNIENFILPAIYEGLFDKVIWIKQLHGQTSIRGQWYEAISHETDGQKITKRLIIEGSSESFGPGITKRKFLFLKQHVNQITPLKNVCLDIDLDYFSCEQDPLSTCHKIEITKSEYERHLENPYNRLRYFEFGRVDVLKEENHYYYLLNNYLCSDHSALKTDENIILLRIGDAVNRLAQKNIRPQIITICRSRYSGYTPADQWGFIERELVKKLELAYGPLAIRHISDITKDLA
jgi:hypothetical protein